MRSSSVLRAARCRPAAGTEHRAVMMPRSRPARHLDQAFTQATNNVNGWRSATLRLAPGTRVELHRGPERRRPSGKARAGLDRSKTLQVLRREPFAALSRGQQWRSWVRFVHTGEAGGWWGETLALTACGAAILSITGIALSFDRLRRWQRSQRRIGSSHV